MSKKNKKCVSPDELKACIDAALKALESSQKHAAKLAKKEEKAILALLELEALVEDASLCKCSDGKKKSKKSKSRKKSAKKSKTVETSEPESQSAEETSPIMPLLSIVEEVETEVQTGEPDDLALIAGVGPGLAAKLKELNVTSFQQIVDWTAADISRIDLHLSFPGRIVRENWVEQAKALAAGGRDEYVRVFGKEPR